MTAANNCIIPHCNDPSCANAKFVPALSQRKQANIF